MNKQILIIGAVVIILGGIYYSSMNDLKNEPNVNEKINQVLETEKVISQCTEGLCEKAGSYEVYSPEKIARAENGQVVLFFRASWCPTCRVVNADINANILKIPSNLSILDIDYDNSKELKKKYGVTYQHTFVQVDKDGNLIKKWVGSPTLESLISEIK